MEDQSRTDISHHGRRDFRERNEIENQVYATVFPVLAKYESRGFNAHQRTQNIAKQVGDQCEEFVRQNVRGQDADS